MPAQPRAHPHDRAELQAGFPYSGDRGARALVVEPHERDDVPDVGLTRDPPRRRADAPWEHRVLGDPPLRIQLCPHILGEDEVGGMVAMEMADLVAPDLEGE